MASMPNTNIFTQAGFIIKDIQESRCKFAHFFGVEEPGIIDGGKEGACKWIQDQTRVLKSVMARTGSAGTRSIDPTVIWHK